MLSIKEQQPEPKTQWDSIRVKLFNKTGPTILFTHL